MATEPPPVPDRSTGTSNRKLAVLASVSLLLAFVISGVGLNPLPSGPLVGSSWRLVSVSGQPSKQPATLHFNAGTLFLDDGCNDSSGLYWLVGSRIYSSALFSTVVGCVVDGKFWYEGDPSKDGLLTADDLRRFDYIAIDGDTMTLSGDPGAEVFRFVRVRD